MLIHPIVIAQASPAYPQALAQPAEQLLYAPMRNSRISWRKRSHLMSSSGPQGGELNQARKSGLAADRPAGELVEAPLSSRRNANYVAGRGPVRPVAPLPAKLAATWGTAEPVAPPFEDAIALPGYTGLGYSVRHAWRSSAALIDQAAECAQAAEQAQGSRCSSPPLVLRISSRPGRWRNN